MTLFDNILSYRHLEMLRTVFCAAFLILFMVGMPSAWAQNSVQAVSSETLGEVSGDVSGEALDNLSGDALDNAPDGEALESADVTLDDTAPVEDPYLVENIEVDVTAGNAVEAREQAFEAAQIKGYEMLAARLLSAEALKSFEAPDINTVSVLVQDYEVTNEKLSATRYKGTYQIRYNRNAFSSRAYAMQANLPQGSTLVLPFYEHEGRARLWQDNPFMSAWGRALGNGTLKNIIIPVGDIDDISQIRGEQALNYNPMNLTAMRMRYQATDVILLKAVPDMVMDKVQRVLVSIYKAEARGPKLARQLTVQIYPGEISQQFYNRVVAEVRQALQGVQQPPQQYMVHGVQQHGMQRQGVQAPNGHGENAQMQNAQAQNIQAQNGRRLNFNPHRSAAVMTPLTGPEKTITARVGFNSVREWVKTKRELEHVHGVKNVQVKSLSPRSAVVDLDFQGDIQRLRGALHKVGLGLKDTAPQYGAADKLPTYKIYSVRSSGGSVSRSLAQPAQGAVTIYE